MKSPLKLRRRHRGFSLVEMMIAMTIGLMIVAGLTTIFANTSQTQNEMRRTSQQIENGRYAMDVLTQDIQVTGFWGSYRQYTAPTALPTPCSLLQADLTNAIGLPIQGYNAPNSIADPTLPASCTAALLPASATNNGSDVLMIWRADTQFVAMGTVTKAGQYYTQANPSTLELQLGGGTTSCTSKADGTAAAVLRRLQYPNSTDVCNGTGSPAGYIRQLHVNIYFVSPCNVPSGGPSAACDATADNGLPVPTLKRIELTTDGANPKWSDPVSIAEGVEYMKIAYGIDDTPNTVNTDTGLVGDGSPDRYVLAPTLADLTNAVTVRVDLLVRNPEPSAGYTDTKTYALGVDTVVNTNPAITVPATSLDQRFRRHVYTSEVRLVNLASRKEIP